MKSPLLEGDGSEKNPINLTPPYRVEYQLGKIQDLLLQYISARE